MSFRDGGGADDGLELDLDYSWNTDEVARAEDHRAFDADISGPKVELDFPSTRPAAPPVAKPPMPAADPFGRPPAIATPADDSMDLGLELPDDFDPPPTSAMPPSASPMPPVPVLVGKPVPQPARASPEPEPSFSCPKCSYAQAPGVLCVACGVVFAKIKPPRAPSLIAVAPDAPVPAVSNEEAAPSPSTAPPVKSALADDKQFWPHIGRCLIAPFLGMGALWIVVVSVVLILATFFGGRLGLFLKLGWLGLLANYFAACVSQGLDGDLVAPPLKRPHDVMSEYVWPGLALIGLSIVLWAAPGYLAFSIVAGAVEQVAPALDESLDVEERMDGWNPDEVFRFQNGEFRMFRVEDDAAIVKRSDGNWVKVIPDEGILLILGKNYDPASGDPFTDDPFELAPAVDADAEAEADTMIADAWRRVDIPVGKLLLFFALVFVALSYWPMGLAVAALGEDIWRTFNPVVVGTCAMKGGVPYLVVVVGGFLTVSIAIVIALQLSWMLATLVVLGAIAYNAAAQGFLMGRLVASNDDLNAALTSE